MITKHVRSLQTELQKYFPDLSEMDLKLIRNPFTTDVESVDDMLQEEVIDLVNDICAYNR